MIESAGVHALLGVDPHIDSFVLFCDFLQLVFAYVEIGVEMTLSPLDHCLSTQSRCLVVLFNTFRSLFEYYLIIEASYFIFVAVFDGECLFA